MSFLVIANPHAGRGRGAHVLGQVEEALRKRGVPHSTALSGWAGHAVDLASQAARDGAAGLVLVGGDGTLFEALNGMSRAGRLLPVAQIPIGTGNSFIKDLGIETTEDGLAALSGGKTRRVDIGIMRSSAGECRFANIVGPGSSRMWPRARHHSSFLAMRVTRSGSSSSLPGFAPCLAVSWLTARSSSATRSSWRSATRKRQAAA